MTGNFVLIEGSPALQEMRAGGPSVPSLIHLLSVSHRAQNSSIPGTEGIIAEVN